MFSNLSKAGLGVTIVTVLNFVFPMIGVEVPEGSTAAFIESMGNVLGFILLVYGQIDRKDLNMGLFRKPVDN